MAPHAVQTVIIRMGIGTTMAAMDILRIMGQRHGMPLIRRQQMGRTLTPYLLPIQAAT